MHQSRFVCPRLHLYISTMATGWLRGTVKEVASGDTLVIMGPSRGGPPPEKRLTLASLIAPRLVRVSAACASSCRRCVLLATPAAIYMQARRDGSTADEPFAWQSREFLRQKSIGQVHAFALRNYAALKCSEANHQ